MKSISEKYEKEFGNLPVKVLQFGEGNFLRAFVDWMIELSNRRGDFNGSVLMCQPKGSAMKDRLNAQSCQYTVLMRGRENGKEVENIDRVSSVSRCINPRDDYDELMNLAHSPDLKCVVSNTTEAGIAYNPGDLLTDRPCSSFPGKLCAFLYERFKAFKGASDKGLLILPAELIDDNGRELKRIALKYAEDWGLESAFAHWLDSSCEFASTLVDRIVTGFPREEIDGICEKLGYRDDALVACELFNLWVIQADRKWAEVFPVQKTLANVVWTNDVAPYKKRKVRILNGAHTSTVLAAYLCGHDTVLDCMNDPAFKNFVSRLLFDEVVPTLDMPKDELTQFANSVCDRFANPFIRHRLLDIALNSQAKFHARCLPSLMAYNALTGALPQRLTFALAAFVLFYRGEWIDGRFMGTREDGTRYEIRDDKAVLDFFSDAWKGSGASVVHKALSNAEFWGGEDLTKIAGLESAVQAYLDDMLLHGVKSVVKSL